MSTSSTIKTTTKSKNGKNEKITSVSVIKPKKNKKKNKNRKIARSTRNCYADLLNNPFEANPCKIGFGCMVPSVVGTMLFRSSQVINADGSIGVFLIPTLGNTGTTSCPIFVNVAGAGTTVWSAGAWTNIGQFPSTLTDELRVISCGLKITPLIAATATPGICFAGSVAGESRNDLAAYSPSSSATLANLQSFVTSNHTITALSRPIDNAAYEFLTVNYSGSPTNQFSHSSPFISLTGYPASSTVLIEAILHFEYIPVLTSTNLRANMYVDSPDEPKLSSDFVSSESMWEYTRRILTDPAVLDIGNTFMGVGTSALNYMSARALNRGIQGARQNRLQ